MSENFIWHIYIYATFIYPSFQGPTAANDKSTLEKFGEFLQKRRCRYDQIYSSMSVLQKTNHVMPTIQMISSHTILQYQRNLNLNEGKISIRIIDNTLIKIRNSARMP